MKNIEESQSFKMIKKEKEVYDQWENSQKFSRIFNVFEIIKRWKFDRIFVINKKYNSKKLLDNQCTKIL